MRFARGRRALAAAVLLTIPGLPAAAAAGPDDLGGARAVLRYTENGIPHILAKDFTGLGYGYGYAVATDNLCLLADAWLTVDAQRSRYHGPDGSTDGTLSSATGNLNSDLHFQQIIDSGVVGRLAAQPAPLGPRQEIKDIVHGYAQGYDRYLAEKGGANGVADPACHGKPWVKPISDAEVYRLFYALTTISGVGTLADGIDAAAPGPAAPQPTAGAWQAGLAKLNPDDEGSNAIGIGSAGTADGKSVLLTNPHFPWRGANRFWQAQLTVPGKLDVSGAGLLGTPFVEKGYNDRIAWSHTLSTPRTFGLYQVQPAPGDPTSYIVDGVKEKMTADVVKVQAKQPDGSLTTVERTLYSTRYGPMLTSAVGVPLPWTAESAYSVRDANVTNLRGLNAWFGIATANNTGDVVKALSSTEGTPWVNTVAVDRAGNALYADIQPVPHVTDAEASTCGTALGKQLFPATGVSVLDGSTSSCAWGSDPDAIEPGLFSPKIQPVLTRKDYVLNANGSAWLTNLNAPITGYPRIIGDIGTERTLRTREELATVTEQMPFTRDSMQRMLYADRSRLAVLAAADTAKMCAAFPGGKAPSASGPVEVGPACGALSAWDGHYTVDSRGSLLFERFALQLASVPGGPWRVPFDVREPAATPNTLDVTRPEVQQAFGNAVAELRKANVPLDGKLGDQLQITRNGQRIPLHGAPEALGVLDLINPSWDPAKGVDEIRTGSSYIQVVGFDAAPCPHANTMLTYSQSSDPTSPYYADQTKLYSASTWVRGRHCEQEILSSPALRIVPLR